MALNRYQKNALEAEMRHLEQTLLQIRQLILAPEDSLLNRHRPVPEARRPRLETLIEEMLEEIRLLAEAFELRAQTEEVSRTIDTEMAQAWADLHDLLSPKLKRYGDVDPSLAETLDPHLKRLIRLTQQMAHVARGKP